jgi:outer membrane protein
MKNISLVFNIVLAIAVAVLYYLHFSSGKKTTEIVSPALTSADAPATVYVNGDSLLNNYEYFKEIKKNFEAKTKRTENDIIAKRSALEKEFAAYQQNAASMTAEQRAKAEESLMLKEQQFRQLSENAGVKLQEEESKVNEELFNKVSAYLKEFSKDKKYKIVMNYTKGNAILFANDSLDITQDVLNGLNEQHKEEKKK